jgi:hypothetical protein
LAGRRKKKETILLTMDDLPRTDSMEMATGTTEGTLKHRPGIHREKSIKFAIANPLEAQSSYSKLQCRFQHLLETTTSPGLPLIREDSPNRDLRFRIQSVNRSRDWLEVPDRAFVQTINNYFHWTFRSSFVAVIISACFFYYFWTYLFAILIYGVMRTFPDCVVGSEKNSYFTDAYHLSWTTLSTVGYGLIGPAVGVQSQRGW